MKGTKLLILLAFLVCISCAKKFRIIHTTDIHGWINAHPHEPTLNADIGDFVSMMEHMRIQAVEKGEELLLFDTGDLIEGTGLSDATPIHGEYILNVIKKLPYDGLTIGNHDVGHPNTIEFMREHFIPHLGDRYITSNTLWRADGSVLGSSYRYFTTPLGHRVLVLGFLYDFKQEANNTIVVDVEQSVTEAYFARAMSEKSVDLIVVINHIDPIGQSNLIDTIYKAVRTVHTDTPLVFLTGHAHQLQYRVYDSNSFALESGCYFQEIGVIDFDLSPTTGLSNIVHQWIPTTLDNFHALAGVPSAQFLTLEGLILKAEVALYYEQLDLDKVLGCSNATYDPDLPLTDPRSFYKFWIEDIMPRIVNSPEMLNTQFYIINTGFLRYNISEGQVVMNDAYTAIPFTDNYCAFPGLPGPVLSSLVNSLATVRSDMIHRKFEEQSSLPHWVVSPFAISGSTTYDLVAADYDCVTIGQVLGALFPSQNYHQIDYPTAFTTSETLIQYFQHYMPCSAS